MHDETTRDDSVDGKSWNRSQKQQHKHQSTPFFAFNGNDLPNTTMTPFRSTYHIPEAGIRVIGFDLGTVRLGVKEEGTHGTLGLGGVLRAYNNSC